MFRNMKIEEVALLLHGLRLIYVADQENYRRKLIKALEGELAARGASLPEELPSTIDGYNKRSMYNPKVHVSE
jgi:hypothetical protein